MMPEENNITKDLKFYSPWAIGMATFIGGPAAAGYLIRKNYLSLDQPEEGRKALIIGILATIILFVGIFSIPEDIIDKVPNQILPLVYTGVIYFLVDKIHGDILKKHKELGNKFYSGWKAAGIGIISLIIIFIGIFGYSYLETSGPEYEEYDTQLEVFYQNEAETLVFYDHIDTKTDSELLKEIISISIPKWKENINIIKKSNTIKNLPSELMEQNILLLKYSELRLEAFEIFKKAINGESSNYEKELDQIHQEINDQIDNLN